jgi:hypothetical protein
VVIFLAWLLLTWACIKVTHYMYSVCVYYKVVEFASLSFVFSLLVV